MDIHSHQVRQQQCARQFLLARPDMLRDHHDRQSCRNTLITRSGIAHCRQYGAAHARVGGGHRTHHDARLQVVGKQSTQHVALHRRGHVQAIIATLTGIGQRRVKPCRFQNDLPKIVQRRRNRIVKDERCRCTIERVVGNGNFRRIIGKKKQGAVLFDPHHAGVAISDAHPD